MSEGVADVRQIVLDTETTGLEVGEGHRVIEVGCVELIKRRYTRNDFHQYLNPERDIEAGAEDVHGLSAQFLANKPRFKDIAETLWQYLCGAELLIHNAPFDVGFLNAEFARVGYTQTLEQVCTITDTLTLARRLMPGQRVSLDALCKRYSVDNSSRALHGALLDARLLADVYLSMTGGQSRLALDPGRQSDSRSRFIEHLGVLPDTPLSVPVATGEELAAHQARLDVLERKGVLRSRW